MFRIWLSQLARRMFPLYRRGRRRPFLLFPSRLRVEQFEVRLLPSTFTVLNANDSGTGSLRQAILNANAAGGSNTIAFAIAPSGVQTIALLSALPAVTSLVVLDGTTKPGYAGTPLVVLNGAGAGSGANGLTITAGNSTVRGLVINQFTSAGIDITGASATGDIVQGNYIGTDVTGSTALGNALEGILVISGAANNTIGGTTAGAGNVISGNSGPDVMGINFNDAGTGNVVQGNLIGTNAAGTAALPNYDGIFDHHPWRDHRRHDGGGPQHHLGQLRGRRPLQRLQRHRGPGQLDRPQRERHCRRGERCCRRSHRHANLQRHHRRDRGGRGQRHLRQHHRLWHRSPGEPHRPHDPGQPHRHRSHGNDGDRQHGRHRTGCHARHRRLDHRRHHRGCRQRDFRQHQRRRVIPELVGYQQPPGRQLHRHDGERRRGPAQWDRRR